MREEVGEPPPSRKKKNCIGFKTRWKVFTFKTKTCITACFTGLQRTPKDDRVSVENSGADGQIFRNLRLAGAEIEDLKRVNLKKHHHEGKIPEKVGVSGKGGTPPEFDADPKQMVKQEFIQNMASVKEKDATNFVDVLEALNYSQKIAYPAPVGDDAKNRAAGGIAAENGLDLPSLEIKDDYPYKIDQTKKRDAPIREYYAQPIADISSCLDLAYGSSIMASKQNQREEGLTAVEDPQITRDASLYVSLHEAGEKEDAGEDCVGVKIEAYAAVELHKLAAEWPIAAIHAAKKEDVLDVLVDAGDGVVFQESSASAVLQIFKKEPDGVQVEDVSDGSIPAVVESVRVQRNIKATNKADGVMVKIAADRNSYVPIKCNHESNCIECVIEDLATVAAVEDHEMQGGLKIIEAQKNTDADGDICSRGTVLLYNASLILKGKAQEHAQSTTLQNMSLDSCCSREGDMNMSSKQYFHIEGAYSAQQGPDPLTELCKAQGRSCNGENLSKYFISKGNTMSSRSMSQAYSHQIIWQIWTVICTAVLITSMEKLILFHLLISYMSKHTSVWRAKRQRRLLSIQVPEMRTCWLDAKHDRRHRKMDHILRYEADSDHG